MPKAIPFKKPPHARDRKQYDRDRAKTKPLRDLYNTQRWRDLRALVLSRDPYCVRCLKTGRVTPSTTANHNPPHEGNESAFWDINSIEGVCSPCHSGPIQKEEKANERNKGRGLRG